MSGVGLYYPHVHFRDERWLKLAALHWDRIYRFYRDDVDDTLPEVSRAEVWLFEAGVVRHTVPTEEDLRQAEEGFEKATTGIDLGKYKLPDGKRIMRDLEQYLDMADYLSSWKATPQLAEHLIDIGLATRFQNAAELWMHETLVRAYLLVLGAQVAPAYGASPIADDELDHSAASMAARRLLLGMSGKQSPVTDTTERDALLVNLAVATVIPRDLNDVRVEEIIQFRERYAGERARFRDAVTDMLSKCTELEGVRDRQVLVDHLQIQFDTRIQPALTDLERAMRGQRIDTAWGAMNIQAAVPPVATSALAVLALHPAIPAAAAIGLGGFAFGVWKSVRDVGAQHDQSLSASHVAYLHHIQADLAPVTLAERVRIAAARLAPRPRKRLGRTRG